MSALYSKDLSARWKTVIAFALLGLLIALIASFVQPLKYSSTVRLLVLQDVGSADAYTASRSVERLAENFATLIFTTAFFDQVMNAGFDIDEAYFPRTEYKKRRQWNRTVAATVTRGSGLLTIRVFHPDVAQAEQIANAIAFIIRREAASYTPGGNVDVRLVDTALNSRWPERPNIPANTFSGLVLGGLVGIAYVLLQSERVRRRHQLVHEEF